MTRAIDGNRKLFDDLMDLARNVGGLDEGFLMRADARSLRQTIHEYRNCARAILDTAPRDEVR